MRHGNRVKFHNWRIDADGFLRVTARVLKEGVFTYSLSDFPPELQPQFPPGTTDIPVYIPAGEFQIALPSLEGKPVIILDHEWRSPENTLTDGLTVGNVAGSPECIDDDGEYIETDFIITDKTIIEKITDKALVEVSAGYDAEFTVVDGDFNGTPYQGIQTNLRFNHILLLPVGEGRCGYDVRIINKKKEIVMEHTVTVRIGNAERTYAFSTPKDKEEALRWLNEATEEKDKEVKEEKKKTEGLDMEAVKNALEELPKLKEQTDAHLATIDELKKQIESLTDPENQEKVAKELLEDAEKEESVSGDLDDKDKSEVAQCKNRADRKKLILAKVLNKRGLKIDGMSDETINALFSVEAANAKARVGNEKKVVHPFLNKDKKEDNNRFFAGRFGNKGGK